MRPNQNHFLVAYTDKNYGRNAADTGAATNPNDLYPGCVGIFTSDGALVTGAAGLSGFGSALVAVQTSDGPLTVTVNRRAVTGLWKKDYDAPVKQVSFIGYNTSSGSMNYSVTVGDDVGIKIIETTKGHEPLPRDSYSERVKTGDTLYDVMSRMAQDAYNRVNGVNSGSVEVNVVLGVVGNVAGTAFVAATQYTGSGTPTVSATNGTKTLTVASTSITSWDLADGSEILIDGQVYKQVSSSVAANVATITLDRTYVGTTQSAGAVSTTNGASGATQTEYGFKITAGEFGQHFRVARYDSFETATITNPEDGSPAVAFNSGFGTYAKVLAAEKKSLALRGYHNRVSFTRTDLGVRSFRTTDQNYAIYGIDYFNVYANKAYAGQVADPMTVQIAVPTAWYDTSSKGDSLEAILDELKNWEGTNSAVADIS